MTIINEQSYISHHGVKGMKWGIRRNKKQFNNAEAKQISTSSEYKTMAKKRISRIFKMTDKKVKANAELSLLKRAMVNDGLGTHISSELTKMLRKKSGSYYFFDPDDNYDKYSENQNSTQNFRKAALKKYESHDAYKTAINKLRDFNRDSKNNMKLLGKDGYQKKLNELTKEKDKAVSNDHKAEDDLIGVQLNDIGFENTPRNRKAAYGIVFWD